MFYLACEDAKKATVQKLYISAHSVKERQEAYRYLGCVLASEVNATIAQNEPYDI